MCDATIRDGVLICTRPDGHAPGHSFVATWAPDLRHADDCDDE